MRRLLILATALLGVACAGSPTASTEEPQAGIAGARNGLTSQGKGVGGTLPKPTTVVTTTAATPDGVAADSSDVERGGFLGGSGN